MLHLPAGTAATGGYWGSINRPYIGCGCLYPIAVFVVILLLVSLFVDALRFY